MVGTFDFAPSLGEIVLTAYGRIGVRASELQQSHMQDARMAANLLLSEWSNLQPNLWEVTLKTSPLLEGVATYSVDAQTVMILDMYISYGSPSTDRLIFPISRSEFASYPNKSQEGFPTVFWYDRLISQTITLWPVPDGNGPYTTNYYSVRQTSDANLADGDSPEIPYRFYDAFAAGLAWRLAEIYAPQMEQRMQEKAERAWKIAATNDVENVNLFLMPAIGGYFR